MVNNIHNLNKDWNIFMTDFTKAEEEQLVYLQHYRQMTSMQDNCAKNVRHLSYILKQIDNDIKGIERKGCLSDIEREIIKKKKFSLMHIGAKIEEMERELPVRNNGLYLSIILGSNLNVSLLNSDERYRYKQEYESFKLFVTCVILALFFLAYWLPPFRLADALCNFLLVWYYCTLTIRESVLRLNGSRIKGWWVLHHYISCMLCAITLTWRDGKCYEQIRPLFIFLICYIGSVQIIQYKYQTGCLRRLHALGQRHSMDITVEGFSSWMFKGLVRHIRIHILISTFRRSCYLSLLPDMFFTLNFRFYFINLQIIQGYCSYYLFDMYFHMGCSSDPQVFVLALFFALICIGNSVTIAIVIARKFGKKNKDVSELEMMKYRNKVL